MTDEIRPFKIDIPKEEIERYYRKIKDTRVPKKDIVPGAGREYGFTTDWATTLYDFWTTRYDWVKEQDLINQYPHFLTDVEGQTIHFVHARSENPDAIPILLIHGWPGSFYEFSQVMPLLLHPSNASDQAFHCVAPSLPGFCFSSGPPKGQTLQQVARLFHVVISRLGYTRYVLQAGDWGQWVARELAANPEFSPHVLAAHFNWVPAPLPATPSNPREEHVQVKVQDWLHNHLGYAILMRSRPHTVGWMLQDNPVGILAFVGEKYDEAANPAIQSSDLWKRHILTTVSLYYFTDCIMTSCLPYFENVRHENFPTEICEERNRVTVPFGYTSYLYDTRPSSKEGVAKTGNLVCFRENDEAGHFACLEDPEGVAKDLREVVGMVLRGEVKAES